MRKQVFTWSLIAIMVAGCGPAEQPPAVEAADYVYTNGKVYTADDAKPWAEAVAVLGSDIVYVGDSAGAEAYVGDGTTVNDLAGKVLLPGMISTHDHATAFMPFKAGLVMPNNGDPKWMLEQLKK